MGLGSAADGEITRQQAWAAAHETTSEWDAGIQRVLGDGEAPSWDDIPEHDKDWRNFVSSSVNVLFNICVQTVTS